MAFVSKEKLFSKEWFIAYGLIVLGSFILAAGFVFFINPYNFVPGGVYGIGIVVNHLTEGVIPFWPDGFPIGLFGLLLNIPLTIAGIKILGPRFGVKTVLGFVLTSLFMDSLTYFVGSGDILNLENEKLLACVFGGVIVGFGLGLIFKSRATSGGSDIIAMIIAKYTKMPLGQLMIYVDSAIVLIGLVVFKDWKVPLYSWLIIYITGKVIDVTMTGVNYEKMVFIISDKYELIRDKIIDDIKRGGTYIDAKGMYQGVDRKIVFTVVSRRELSIIKAYVSEIDPGAFITVAEANEILGSGFKSLQQAAAEEA